MLSQELINQIAPLLATCVLGVTTAVIKTVGDAAIALINKKKDAVATQIGIDKYNSNLNKARDIWGVVDEEFRISPTLIKTIESAQKLFEEKIIKVIPGITKGEIEQLRQVVAGEINKGKAFIATPVEETKTVTASVKYVAPDGTELQPVNSGTAANADQTAPTT